MTQSVEAIYEHGILRPLQPLRLSESQRVTLTISDATAVRHVEVDRSLVERIRAEVSTLENAPTIEEVRAALASIPGSLSDDVIAERGDY